MRTSLVIALLASATAHAQFANRRIGLEVSPMRFTDRELTTGLMAVLDGAVYLDNGFELGLRVPFAMFLTGQSNQQRLGTGGQAYARYLFLQESLRPWIDLEVDVLYIFRDSTDGSPNEQVFAGPGASAGLEYFLTNEVSIGARAMFTLYFGVNNSAPVRPSYGGTASVQVYF